MRWKAHTRTAERVIGVFDALHFSKYEKDLVNGIISPDNEDEKTHYVGREQTALDYVKHARERRLAYDTGGCFFQLGVAFHYIQDMWTGVGPDTEGHGAYLDLINRCDILDVHESLERYYPVGRMRVLSQFRALEKRLSKPVQSMAELKELILMKRPYESSAFLDLNLSFRVCYRVAEMVLKTMLNVNLQESLELLQNEYVEKVRDAEALMIREIETIEAEVGKLALSDSQLDGVKQWGLDRRLSSLSRDYEERRHLKTVLAEFERRVEELCKPHVEWYNIDRPVLDVDRILLPDKEAAISAQVTNAVNEQASDAFIRFEVLMRLTCSVLCTVFIGYQIAFRHIRVLDLGCFGRVFTI